jgi:hypothetical protein
MPSQTLCYAAYLPKTVMAAIFIEPSAVLSLLPNSFGYNIPWMARKLLPGSYGNLTELIDKGPSQDADMSFKWHPTHFKYLLLTMLEGDCLIRTDLLRSEKVPVFVTG